MQNKKIKNAVSSMLQEADAIAAGDKKAANFNDILGLDDQRIDDV